MEHFENFGFLVNILRHFCHFHNKSMSQQIHVARIFCQLNFMAATFNGMKLEYDIFWKKVRDMTLQNGKGYVALIVGYNWLLAPLRALRS